jgi:hypothetical protein
MNMDGLRTDKDGDGYNDAASVEDSDLLELANAGFDWFCTHCGSGNRGDGSECSNCGSPRYGEAKENHPALPKPSLPIVIPPPEPERDWEELPTPSPDRSKWIFGGAGVVFLVFVLFFGYWASRTHDVVGAVSRMAWSRTVTVEAWTPYTERQWKHRATQRLEVKPVNGRGERAGYELVPGSCKSEHYEDERYRCGTREESYDCSTSHTESYQGTCTKSESYTCGETCRDQGNGFATCSPRLCTRTVSYSCTKTRQVKDPKTCYRDVPKYCERPVYRDKCSYESQKWVVSRNPTLSGTGKEMSWPEPVVGPLERSSRSSEYTVTWTYEDGGKKDSFSRPLPEAEYLSWDQGQKVYMKVTRIGAVADYSATPITE